MRLLAIFLFLALLFTLPFLIWGDAFEATFTVDGAVDWLRGWGSWAWAAGIILLVLDIVLPVPATAVMTALGAIYGPVIGGVIGTVGSMLSGAAAYVVCRSLGRSAALKLAGERDLARGEQLFARAGGWAVALSRWLPLFPEVITCMAGLARMPPWSFATALACGAAPMAFTFAAVGTLIEDRPLLTIALSAFLPIVLWPAAHLLLQRRARGGEND